MLIVAGGNIVLAGAIPFRQDGVNIIPIVIVRGGRFPVDQNPAMFGKVNTLDGLENPILVNGMYGVHDLTSDTCNLLS